MPKSVHRATVYPVRRSVRLRPGKTLPVKPSPAPIHSVETYDFPPEKKVISLTPTSGCISTAL
ncbi:hypothetical protein [Methanosarcina horonobensis]|uniref:hypothetical protein n=1 Tax=Methanosarcina horonobensis TaxID=418008 RepID=UPI000A82F5CC|nr:hypothetical protein [Methanosarcina horonobensis]